MKIIPLLSIGLLCSSLHTGIVLAETNLENNKTPYSANIQANGSIIISQGNQVIQLVKNSLLEQLGLEQSVSHQLLNLLLEQEVAPGDLVDSLTLSASHYQQLKTSVSAIQASNKTIQALKERAEAAVVAGDFTEVKALLNQIHKLSLSATPVMSITAAEADAANGARANSQLAHEEAADYYLRASNNMKSLGQKHHEKWSDYADKAGSAFQEAGYYREAAALLKTALDLRTAHTPNSPLAIISMDKLANLHRLSGDYEAALPLYQGIVANKQKNLGENHIDVAVSLNDLADLYRLNGDYQKSLPYYQKALSISENHLGTEHEALATILNNMAGLYEVTGNHEAALPLYERAIAISEKTLGEDHPDVGTMLNNLAGLYRAIGDFGTALPLYERDLAISRKALGEEHPGVATTFNNLGILYFHMKNYEKSVDYLRQAVIIFESTLGEEHPKTTSANESLEAISKYL